MRRTRLLDVRVLEAWLSLSIEVMEGLGIGLQKISSHSSSLSSLNPMKKV
ncbi:MAG: hypothetical protein QXO22_08580 [Thermosphaera sp.]